MGGSERIAVFAGSFDPFTIGHGAVVEAALRLFDRVVIGVGHNISKRGLLSTEGRVRLIEDVYATESRVSVRSYEGLTSTFAREVGATALVRGIRGSQDLETERELYAVNRGLSPDLQTVMLFTPAELSHISSSCVRELLAFRAEVKGMMPEGIDINKYM